MSLRRCVFAALIAVLVVAGICRAQAGEPSQKSNGQTWAVVVGVSKYSKLPGGQQLQFADRDAIAFADAMKKAGVAAQNMRVLTGPDATATAIKAAIGNWLARSASENDTVYVFFSGHGFVEPPFGESYILAHDSDSNDPYTTALSINELGQALSRRVRARNVVIIADAIRKDLFPPEAGGDATSKSFVQSFDQLAASRKGLSIILANGPGEFSREGQRWGGHGVFAKHLVDALAGGADRDSNNSITAEEVFQYLSSHLAVDTSNKQNPWRTQTTLAQITMSHTSPRATSAPAQAKQEPPRVSPPQTKSAEIISKNSDPKNSDPLPAEPARAKPEPKTEPPARVTNAPTTNTPVTSAPVTSTPVTGAASPRVAPPEAKSPEAKPSPAPNVNTKTAPVKPRVIAPPEILALAVSAPQGAFTANAITFAVNTAALPAPPKPVAAPPRVSTIAASPTSNQAAGVSSTVPIASVTTAPSPLVLQLEAAIHSGNLIEPKNASAWDIYQQLAQQQSDSAGLNRLKPMLAEALMKSGLSIIKVDARADTIAERVDEFKRAGQMFSRARSLMPDSAEIGAYEKLSAAQALLALQFYDEAERALTQLQPVKLAAVENALGLVYMGKLDLWRAERAFNRAVEMDPAWAAPHYNLALHHRNQKNEAALNEFERAAALDPKNVSFVTALGDEYFNRQQWQQAAEAYLKAIALKPSDDALHTKLGHALYSQGLRDEANRAYQKARDLRGKQP